MTADTSSSASKKPRLSPLTLTYFPLWAKGPAPALALAFSGLDWTGGTDYGEKLANYKQWRIDKPSTTWGYLPTLDTPAGQVCGESAILNFVARKAGPRLAGIDDKEFMTSQQLIGVSDDIYRKLELKCDTAFKKLRTLKDGEREAFWSLEDVETKSRGHNSTYSLAVYLAKLEAFHARVGCDVGRFTQSGTSIGECKLFATLHTCVMIRKGCLDTFPKTKAFYERFLAEKPTQEMMTTCEKMGRSSFFAPYFIA